MEYIAQIPARITSIQKEIENQIQISLESIQEKNKILRGLHLLRSGKVKGVKLSRRVSKKRRLKVTKLKQARKRCEELRKEYWKEWWKIGITDEEREELNQEYDKKILLFLQHQLNVTYNLMDEMREKELGDLVFYYLMKSEEPDQPIQKLIQRLYYPRFDPGDKYFNYSWYGLCCVVLGNPEMRMFHYFFERLNKNVTALEYLLYKHPKILFDQLSTGLINKLFEHLSHHILHQILTSFRDPRGQTCMFFVSEWATPFLEIYSHDIKDFYELMLIQNTDGQTALHVNPSSITSILVDIYTPKQRSMFVKLISLTDKNNRTALQCVQDEEIREELHSLVNRVEKNEYTTWAEFNTNILIIYNTNNRPGAEEEAQTIYEACQSKYQKYNIDIEADKNEGEIMDLIEKSANFSTPGNLHTSLIVILASHGSIGLIEDCNRKPIKLSEIEKTMCADVLDGKPKMLITQCCQDTTLQANKEDKVYAPTHDDFCAVMSSVPGTKSRRGVFLSKLADRIKNCKTDANIFKLVNSVSTEMEKEGHKQTPLIMSTLKADFRPIANYLG